MILLCYPFPSAFLLESAEVCPSSLRGNWLEEASRWLPSSVLPDPDWRTWWMSFTGMMIGKGWLSQNCAYFRLDNYEDLSWFIQIISLYIYVLLQKFSHEVSCSHAAFQRLWSCEDLILESFLEGVHLQVPCTWSLDKKDEHPRNLCFFSNQLGIFSKQKPEIFWRYHGLLGLDFTPTFSDDVGRHWPSPSIPWVYPLVN